MDKEKQMPAPHCEAACRVPEALGVSSGRIQTASDFASMMSSLINDLLAGRVTPQVGNAVCNAGGKLLKVVEMQYKYGAPATTNGQRVLRLVATGVASTEESVA